MSEYTEGLRELADWFDAHPEIVPPCYDEAAIKLFPPEADLPIAVRALGSFDKDIPEGSTIVYLSKTFHGVTLKVVFNRGTVCTRVVVGQRVVPAEPEKVIPARPEHTEEIVEWHCDESLLEKAK